jgi:hypothetical protein
MDSLSLFRGCSDSSIVEVEKCGGVHASAVEVTSPRINRRGCRRIDCVLVVLCPVPSTAADRSAIIRGYLTDAILRSRGSRTGLEAP